MADGTGKFRLPADWKVNGCEANRGRPRLALLASGIQTMFPGERAALEAAVGTEEVSRNCSAGTCA